MKVIELIARLQELPQEAHVIINDSENLFFNLESVFITDDSMYIPTGHENEDIVMLSPNAD